MRGQDAPLPEPERRRQDWGILRFDTPPEAHRGSRGKEVFASADRQKGAKEHGLLQGTGIESCTQETPRIGGHTCGKVVLGYAACMGSSVQAGGLNFWG
jgi:hypothetical protein